MNILNIIQEYAKRCFPVYQLLHKDPQCHPKLRSYAQSFSLDQEAFIRHVMLHSFKCEYIEFACELTFEFWHEFGWTDEMIAYENIIRITADVLQIVLIHLDTFPKCTFIMLLYAIINYCKIVTENMTSDKFEAIQNILFRTLSSINDIVSKTCYCNTYNTWLKRIQNIKISDMETEKYYDEICKWTDSIFPYEIETFIDNKCVCNETFYCKYHGFLIKRKIAAKYNAYMFIRECMKLQNNTKFQYYEQLIRNLFIL
ncbi:PREDICTED: uncharacterized protein LOC108746373 [Trachymyrmex septentrionalis]|uniref:uncharacterized protein LOC108746373 n=1 Tax=Trachymyrmex septentrionalis TaxID=34720 RepID=UPI00084EE750|nr:PREDICTED: uncharacterized protein LOC108746373 [Trachymyrmex septentrionalis]